jgi:hypothetical protein
MSLFAELKGRNVFRVAMLCTVAGWVLLQVGDLLFGALGVPPWGIKLLLGMLLLGFPMAPAGRCAPGRGHPSPAGRTFHSAREGHGDLLASDRGQRR